MEDVFINIDSQYRNILNPNETESKFNFNMMNTLKNIDSVKLSSIEITNSINIVSSNKNNNYFTIHLPNKLNDPTGWLIKLPDGLIQNTLQFKVSLNNIFKSYFNNYVALQGTQFPTWEYNEKYSYIFYLKNDIEIEFDFNTAPLIINKNWTSLYGLVVQIQNYITDQYNSRQYYLVNDPINKKAEYITNHPEDPTGKNFVYTPPPPIPLDEGNFIMYDFDVDVFDRRFRSVDTKLYGDCIRTDSIKEIDCSANNLTNNLAILKYAIYTTYLDDTSTYYLSNDPNYSGKAILDQLNSSTYEIPFGYKNAGNKLLSNYIYYINNSTNIADLYSINLYNLIVKTNPEFLLLSINNSFDKIDNTLNLVGQPPVPFYYYYVNESNQTWDNSTNTLDNLLDINYLLQNGFISQADYESLTFKPTLQYDIPTFEINFETGVPFTNPINNSILDINKMKYTSLGYYLGYRPIYNSVSYSYLLKSTINHFESSLVGTKIPNTNGSNYLFLRINDWGLYDFFGKKVFAKIILPATIDNSTYGSYIIGNYYINSEFKFRQPQNIKKLEIELFDYIGNNIDLNGVDWSFTLQFSEEYNSDNKVSYERNNLVFNNIQQQQNKIFK